MITLILSFIFILLLLTVYLYFLRIKNKNKSFNEVLNDSVILKISLPSDNEKPIQEAEEMYKALHTLLLSNGKSDIHFSLELVSNYYGIYFLLVCERNFKQIFITQIYDKYPEAHVEQINDYTFYNRPGVHLKGVELTLGADSLFPFKTFNNIETNPVIAIINSVAKLQGQSEAWIQIVVRPLNDSWKKYANKKFLKIKSLKGVISNREEYRETEGYLDSSIKSIENKLSKKGYQFIIRIISLSTNETISNYLLEDIQSSFDQFYLENLNGLKIRSEDESINKIISKLTLKDFNESLNILERFQTRYLKINEGSIISTEELTSLFHLPNKSFNIPSIVWSKAKKLEHPNSLPIINCDYFALSDYRNSHVKFGIKKQDKEKGVFITGKSSSGKTTVLKNLLIPEIYRKSTSIIIDSKGDLYNDLLNTIPFERLNDVVLIDPTDKDITKNFNVLNLEEKETKEILTNEMIESFRKFFDKLWNPKLEYILTNTLLCLCEVGDVNLTSITKVLNDSTFRTEIITRIKDPFLKQFMGKELELIMKNKQLVEEGIDPIVKKFNYFLNSKFLINYFDKDNNLNLSSIINSNKILLINLPKDTLGEETASFLGSLIISKTSSILNSLNEKKEISIYIDELDGFAKNSFTNIVRNSNKFGVSINFTVKDLDSISENYLDLLFDNLGTIITFEADYNDSALLGKKFEGYLRAEDFVNLEKFKMVLKMQIDNSQSKPFTAISLPLQFQNKGYAENIKKLNYNN